MSGLFIAAIFAAAISTLDSALAESSDVSLNHIYARYLRPGASERHYIAASRCLIAAWGVVFFLVTLLFNRYSAEGLLDLTFRLPNYVYGAMLGSIVLARMGVGRLVTMLSGWALAIAITLCMGWAGIAFFYWCPVSGAAMVGTVWWLERIIGTGAVQRNRG